MVNVTVTNGRHMVANMKVSRKDFAQFVSWYMDRGYKITADPLN